MDVTLSNFNDVLPEIYEAIDDCDFMAIDTEFTGLSDGPEARITAYDTPEGYYLKLKNCTSEFLLVQVGLCTFKYDEARNKYTHKAYNFYVFPRTIGRFGNDVKFLCQSSSIHFLSDSGFDFNKLYKEGIPYLNSTTEKTLLEELDMKYENLRESDTFSKVSIPDNLKSTVEHACTRIERFLSSDNEETEIIFERCNAFVRKLIFQEAYERFPSKNFNLSTKSINNNLVLVAQKNKSKTEMEKENFERDKNEILEAVGFSKVIRRIADSKKLIMGHNMFLDVCHIVNRFCQPLPDSYDEFKKTVHALFPRVVDTKYMCSADPFTSLIKSSVIEHLMETLKKSPFNFTETEPSNPEFAYSTDQKKEHEAGFDAYLTGLIFISLGSYLLPSDRQKNMIHDRQVLKAFENKIFIMRIIDYSYFDLVKEEPKPDRNHVFHITFPEKWRTKNIVQLFQPFGDVSITWCSRTSAWVSLYKPELAKTVINELVRKYSRKRLPYTLLTWDEFANNSSLSTAEILWRNYDNCAVVAAVMGFMAFICGFIFNNRPLFMILSLLAIFIYQIKDLIASVKLYVRTNVLNFFCRNYLTRDEFANNSSLSTAEIFWRNYDNCAVVAAVMGFMAFICGFIFNNRALFMILSLLAIFIYQIKDLIASVKLYVRTNVLNFFCRN